MNLLILNSFTFSSALRVGGLPNSFSWKTVVQNTGVHTGTLTDSKPSPNWMLNWLCYDDLKFYDQALHTYIYCMILIVILYKGRGIDRFVAFCKYLVQRVAFVMS